MGRKAYRVRKKMKVENSNLDNKVDTKEIKFNLTKSLSREIKVTMVTVFVVFLVALQSTYSIFTSTDKSKDYNRITVGTLQVDFLQDTVNIINLNGAYPISDTDGLLQTPYSFKLSNSGSLDASYKIRIVNDEDIISEDGCQDNLLNFSDIKVSVNGDTPFILSSKVNDDFVIENGIISSSNTKKYDIRIWIDENAGNNALNKHYHGKIIVDSVNLNS